MFKPNGYWQHRMVPGVNGDNGDDVGIGCLQGAVFIVIIFVMFALCAIFGSCTTTEYVTVEKVKHDTTYVSKVQRDSIYIHDSISVDRKDSIIKIEHWHTKYVDHAVHDTVYQATHDTIPQPYPVIKEVEKPLSRRQKAVFTIGVMTIIGVLCWIVWWAVKILRRFGILRI